MAYKLVCVREFHGYVKGQTVKDPDEVAALLDDREHHFVRVPMTPDDHAEVMMARDAALGLTQAALAKAAE